MKTVKKTQEEIDAAMKILAAKQAEDSTMVELIFQNLETPGSTLVFGHRVYPDEEVEQYELTDGQRYRLPLGVARHLQHDCWYKVYSHLPGEEHKGQVGIRVATYTRGLNVDGKLRPVMHKFEQKHRFRVIPLNFGANELGLNPVDLTTVQYSV